VRILLLALAAALVAATSVVGPPSSVVLADGTDLLPTESELTSTLSPFTISGYMAGPGKDGWDGNAEFDVNGAPDGLIHGSVDASELPSKEGAAGFLQTKLQQLRDGTRQSGFVGDIAPAGNDLTFDADEAYWGVYLSPQGAPPLMVAIHVSRYDTEVIAITVMQSGGPHCPRTTRRPASPGSTAWAPDASARLEWA
jgi:hypothetical protein